VRDGVIERAPNGFGRVVQSRQRRRRAQDPRVVGQLGVDQPISTPNGLFHDE
jgi:hypothetical protein